MAKTETKTEPTKTEAPAAPATTEALATTNAGAVATTNAGAVATTNAGAVATTEAGEMEAAGDDFFQQWGHAGADDFTKDDVLIPRLSLAQALSPQVTEGDPKMIPGLTAGDMFNSMTGENYKREIFVQILKKEPLRAMEWFPIDDGGGIKDPNVPLNDPRCKWGEDGEKPVAVIYRDYIARILPSGELIGLSFKSSGIKVAKRLNGLIVFQKGPIFKGRYRLTTGVELNPKPHKVWLVENAGNVSTRDAVEGAKMSEALRTMITAIHQDDAPDPDDFDPSQFEGGAPKM